MSRFNRMLPIHQGPRPAEALSPALVAALARAVPCKACHAMPTGCEAHQACGIACSTAGCRYFDTSIPAGSVAMALNRWNSVHGGPGSYRADTRPLRKGGE
jgi:hypothetical protein